MFFQPCIGTRQLFLRERQTFGTAVLLRRMGVPNRVRDPKSLLALIAARLTVMLDLPTPPLPEPTAMMRATWGIGRWSMLGGRWNSGDGFMNFL